MQICLARLLDDDKCFDHLREVRWPEGRKCPHCESSRVVRQGVDDTQPARHRYRCNACFKRFDDLTGTIFEGRHQPLRLWLLALYLLGLNLSNEQIAQELELHPRDVHDMLLALREGIVKKNRLSS